MSLHVVANKAVTNASRRNNPVLTKRIQDKISSTKISSKIQPPKSEQITPLSGRNVSTQPIGCPVAPTLNAAVQKAMHPAAVAKEKTVVTPDAPNNDTRERNRKLAKANFARRRVEYQATKQSSSTTPPASTTTTITVVQKATGPAANQKTDRVVTPVTSREIQIVNLAKKEERSALNIRSATTPLASTTTTTVAVASTAIVLVAAATPQAAKDVNKSKALAKKTSDTPTISSESRLSKLTQPKMLFIESLVALSVGLGAFAAKVGPALAGQLALSNATLASQLIVSNTIGFLTPGIATVGFAGKIAVDATVVATQITWPLLMPILSTIVVGIFALILVTYIASKVLETLKSRIYAAFQAMVDSLNSTTIGYLIVKAANVGISAFTHSGKPKNDRSIPMETNKSSPAETPKLLDPKSREYDLSMVNPSSNEGNGKREVDKNSQAYGFSSFGSSSFDTSSDEIGYKPAASDLFGGMIGL
jgi:hypothetical protein